MSTARRIFAGIGALVAIFGGLVVFWTRSCDELECLNTAFGWAIIVAGLFILAASTIGLQWKKWWSR